MVAGGSLIHTLAGRPFPLCAHQEWRRRAQ